MSLSDENEYKVMFWNARGVRNKIFELTNLITYDDLDIICVNETFLDENAHIPAMPGYNIVRLDKTNHSGGLMFIIKESINYTEIECPQRQLIECAAIQITHSTTFNIFLIYCPGGTGEQALISSNFEPELLDMCDSRVPYFIVGDFNAKHRAWDLELIIELVDSCTTY